jgi:hypothetical protein
MTEDAKLYRVRWEIEVEAKTPREAAEKARHYQTKAGHDRGRVRGRGGSSLCHPPL